MNRKLVMFTAVLFGLSISACSSSSSKKKALIDPADADAVSEALLIKVDGTEAERKEGNPPAATNLGTEPVISGLLDKVGVTNGQVIKLQVDVSAGSPLAALFAKVVGANDYFQFTPPITKAGSSFEIEITIPETILDGEYCQTFSAQDSDSLTSAPVTVCFEVESTLDNAPPTSDSGTSAKACFNSTLYAQGTQYQTISQETIAFDGEAFSERKSDTYTVGGMTTFDGRTAIEVTDFQENGEGDAAYSFTSMDYFQVDTTNSRFSYLGYVEEDGGFTYREYLRPAFVLRFDLNPGDSYTQSFTVFGEDSSPDGTVNSYSYEETLTISYVGRENVTVPAGTFETCKFSIDYRESEAGTVTSTADEFVYVGVGNGIDGILQEGTFSNTDGTTETYRSELLSASINGTPIR